jgi:hypothetical protein
MGNSGGGGFLIATNGHQSAVISTAQSIQFAAAGASFSPEAANQTIQSIGDKGGPGGQALADAEKGLSQLNVKLPDGSSYTPMSHVKNDVQAKLFGQKKGTPIPFMVAPGVDPEQLVNDWAGKRGSSWNFASYWWPGGRHDYKQTPRIGPMLDGFGNFMYGATGAAAGYSRDELQGMGQAIKWGKNDPVNVQDIDTGFDAINRGGQLFAYPPSR